MDAVKIQNIERRIQLLESKIDSKRITAGAGLLVSSDGTNTVITLEDKNNQALNYHPWRILIKSTGDKESDLEYSVYGGTVNGILASNWDKFLTEGVTTPTWVYWSANLNGNEITDLIIKTSQEAPDIPTAYTKNTLPSRVERLIGIIQGRNVLYQFAKTNYYIQARKMLEVHKADGIDIYYSELVTSE